jgi:hypothetical protein
VTAPRGERHPAARLTAEAVRTIRASAEPQRRLAARYGVSQRTVGRVTRGESWRPIEETTDDDL